MSLQLSVIIFSFQNAIHTFTATKTLQKHNCDFFCDYQSTQFVYSNTYKKLPIWSADVRHRRSHVHTDTSQEYGRAFLQIYQVVAVRQPIQKQVNATTFYFFIKVAHTSLLTLHERYKLLFQTGLYKMTDYKADHV